MKSMEPLTRIRLECRARQIAMEIAMEGREGVEFFHSQFLSIAEELVYRKETSHLPIAEDQTKDS